LIKHSKFNNFNLNLFTPRFLAVVVGPHFFRIKSLPQAITAPSVSLKVFLLAV
jgi:hypothetical protein